MHVVAPFQAKGLGWETRLNVSGLLAKTTLLCVASDLRLFVSLYQAGTSTSKSEEGLSILAGRLALLHFEHQSQSDKPAELDVLSERERAVCLGILAGQKAALIAAEIGVASSNIVTYRKRAKNQLGTSARASLFAICRAKQT